MLAVSWLHSTPDGLTMEHIEPIIEGICDPRLSGVRDAFRQNFIERGEVGASLCVVRHGEVVVDLWGGWTDETRTTAWSADTLVDFYSVGKALVATLLLELVDHGLLTLDTRIAEVWPEFASGGKGAVTVRHALCHEAAVPAIREPLTNSDLVDWSTMTDALAATDAWWLIGTRHAYHTNTYGFLIGEIVHRVTGELPGDRLQRIAVDVDADLWFGVPESHQPRCADVIWAPPQPLDPNGFDTNQYEGDQLMNILAHFNPPGASSVGIVNTPDWRAAQIPSTNGHGTAHGLATFYAALLEPDRILSPRSCVKPRDHRCSARARSSAKTSPSDSASHPPASADHSAPNPNSFGHFGTGGALGFADPDTGIAFGYVMNHVIPRWQSTRNRALIDSLYSAR